MRHAIYKNGDTNIDRCVEGPESWAKNQCASDESIEPITDGGSSSTHFIKESTGRPNLRDMTPCTPSRTELPADGITTLTLSQMRADTQVTIDGPTTDSFTASGSETLTFIMPGVYTITATAPFPARPKEMTINVT